jgi:hypothetical protein
MGNIQRYYKLLGIHSAASLDDIKKAFLEMELGLQLDFESKDPEKRTQAREKLHEIYEAHEKVVRHFMEHGPTKFQEDVNECEAVREAPPSVVTTAPLSKTTGEIPEQEKQTEEINAPTLIASSKILLANKRVSLILISSLTILAAVTVGSLIGIVVFKRSANRTNPSRPLRQAVMTTVTSYQPMSSVVTNGKRHDRTETLDTKKALTGKQKKKKVSKVTKHKPAKPASQISPKSLESIMNAAKHGDAEAQYRLGTMYSKGVGVRKDTAEAVKWFRRAASRGHPKARENLEYVYE